MTCLSLRKKTNKKYLSFYRFSTLYENIKFYIQKTPNLMKNWAIILNYEYLWYEITLLSNTLPFEIPRVFVLLPYKITLLSNINCSSCVFIFVLLPYKITLLSNGSSHFLHRIYVWLPYEITLLSNYNHFVDRTWKSLITIWNYTTIKPQFLSHAYTNMLYFIWN